MSRVRRAYRTERAVFRQTDLDILGRDGTNSIV